MNSNSSTSSRLNTTIVEELQERRGTSSRRSSFGTTDTNASAQRSPEERLLEPGLGRLQSDEQNPILLGGVGQDILPPPPMRLVDMLPFVVSPPSPAAYAAANRRNQQAVMGRDELLASIQAALAIMDEVDDEDLDVQQGHRHTGHRPVLQQVPSQ